MAQAVFLFTGQGSQFVGMGRELVAGDAAARELFARADRALGEPLTRLVQEGPEEELALTIHTQPAVLTLDLAIFQALDLEPAALAGHSLGEYAALVAAGSLEFEVALRLVRARAQAMQSAVPPGRGGMVVLRKATLEEARRLAEEAEAGVLELANINCPGQYVLSGETAALDQVVEKVGARRALRLPVSVPFHSSLLAAAAKEFARRLEEVPFADPRVPLVCNVSAEPLTRADQVKEALARQFDHSVLWEQSMVRLLREGHRLFVECGPKPTLVRMVQAVARKEEVEGVSVHAPTTPGEIDGVRRALKG